MQFAEILPFLHAEIDRLQKARDLLAYVPPSGKSPRLAVEPAFNPLSSEGKPARPADAVAELSVSAAPAGTADSTAGAAPSEDHPVQHMRYKPRRERQATRTHRPSPAQASQPDSALRSAVPAGPVVVSAEEARKAQATRVVPAPADPGQFFGWRERAGEVRAAEALLQRWIDGAPAE